MDIKLIKKYFPTILMILCGALVGFVIGIFINDNAYLFAGTLENRFLNIFFMYIILIVVIYIHIIVHELGHLIFGLLTGYEFVSFRIGNIILIKKDNGLKFKKYSLMGTGGQCLMTYPEYDEDHFPFVLYNLGGIIVNFLLALIFILIYILNKPQGLFSFFCLMMIIVGIANVLLNGIPFKNDYVSNDGYNTMIFMKDKKALKTFYSILKIAEYQSKDIALSKMPQELFELADDADTHNSFNAHIVFCKENICMEKNEFDKAKEYIDLLLSDKYTLQGIHRYMLLLDLLYIDILNNKEVDLSVVEDKKMKNFMKAMANSPSVIRSQYALAIYQKDDKKQEALLKRFDKISKDYPYEVDLNNERKLMELIKNHA